jgi:hypothetical protein
MSRSKDKAYAHETRIAKVLSKWAGQTFMRTPSSGSMRWGGGRWIYADIVPPEDFPILCECKHHADMSIEGVLVQDNKIIEWWRQTEESYHRAIKDLGSYSVYPCMSFRRDYGRDFLAVPQSMLPGRIRYFALEGGITSGMSMAICDMKTFLELFKPEDLMSTLSLHRSASAA